MIFVESHQKHLSQTKTVHARKLLKWNLPAGFASEILKHPPKTIRKKAMVKNVKTVVSSHEPFQPVSATSINIQGAKVVAFVGETFQTYVSAICLGESHVSQRVGCATNPNLVKGLLPAKETLWVLKALPEGPFLWRSYSYMYMYMYIYIYTSHTFIF